MRARGEEGVKRIGQRDAGRDGVLLLGVGIAPLGHLAQQGERLLAGDVSGEQIGPADGHPTGAPLHLSLGEIDLGLPPDPKAEARQKRVAIKGLSALGEGQCVNGLTRQT